MLESGLDALGWGPALDTHRPLLSYAELGALFDGPARFHDALKAILGLFEVLGTRHTAERVQLWLSRAA